MSHCLHNTEQSEAKQIAKKTDRQLPKDIYADRQGEWIWHLNQPQRLHMRV